MALERALKRWQEAGLMDAAQAERIARFERERGRPTLMYAVGALAGLSVAIGLISIVAANWDEIPGWAKLAVDVACVVAVSWLVMRADRRGPLWLREAGIFVLYGLALASVALIGQVYQLGGDAALALAAWSALTLVLMAEARSAQLALAWLLGLQVTFFVWLARLAEEHSALEGLMVAALYWPPLICLGAGSSVWLTRERPEHARVARALGWIELALAGSLGTLAFYERPEPDGRLLMWLGVGISAAATAGLVLTRPRTRAGAASGWLLLAAFAAAHFGLLLPHDDLPIVAALAFIGLWWGAALAAHRAGARVALHVATAAIGLRLIIVYFEVFGSLLDTGLALLSGGVLTLAVMWFWAKQRRELDRGLAGAGGESEGEAP